MKIRGIKLARKAFSDRPKKFSITWLLPNFLTICALIFGLQAFYHSLLENWNLVIIFIIIAAVFDLLDGRVARLLKSTSNFGMYLDSLSDFVVFGTIPPITIYFWMFFRVIRFNMNITSTFRSILIYRTSNTRIFS